MSKQVKHLETIHTVHELRRQVAEWRLNALTVAIVPTMGALHEGHMSLVDRALKIADRSIVSIFVNPTQFSKGEDLERYPRNEEDDLKKLTSVGVDVVYMPRVNEMYKSRALTKVSVDELSQRLCGLHRPELFPGVATVVTKLLIQCSPDYAIFGEKDYQQLQVIKQLVSDLDIPVNIVPQDTVREKDGLALSSRNVYLNAEQRILAPLLYSELQKVAFECQDGIPVEEVIANGRSRLIELGFSKVDYFSLCDPLKLNPLKNLDGPARLLAAAWLGNTRLIDNIEVLPK
jgi:pantoate--beta-alanine ligase|tara:strand:- start:364 stop:1230 length:867 start_codon:yes stop_codon:yes gene_type:complete